MSLELGIGLMNRVGLRLRGDGVRVWKVREIWEMSNIKRESWGRG